MYSNKRSVLQLAALLKAHGVSKMVLCAGSRNIPLIQTLASVSSFSCYPMTDERSAGYFALGLSLSTAQPVVVCCTSGTALLNLHPAIAEAYYQGVPLIVISADRPEAWIGQMDGQTVPQEAVFGSLVKKSVSLPQVHTEEEAWYANRLINEALLATHHRGKGPVHINVPLSLPLFDFAQTELPEERVITRYEGLNEYDRDYAPLIERLNSYQKKMAVVGQANMIYLFDRRPSKQLYKHFVWLAEHPANQTIPGVPIKNFDTALHAFSEQQKADGAPELLITYGGHIISKSLKNYLRTYPPKEHWHVSKEGIIVDLFGALTTVIEMDPFEFWEKIAEKIEGTPSDYVHRWEVYCRREAAPQFAYSAMAAVGALLSALPPTSVLHLANSSAVRYAQLYPIPSTVEVCANRGTNGIEGSLSTALGYAFYSDKTNYLIIGDLSFFYDMNALWSHHVRSNLRILLLNNGGGAIFHTLSGLQLTPAARPYITSPHSASARAWAVDRGFTYRGVECGEQLTEAIKLLTTPEEHTAPILVEVFTRGEEDAALLADYYRQISKSI